MIRLQNVKKEYSSVLFESVSFLLGNNEKVGLVGLNGCGKTTLFRIIAGLGVPDSGMVEIVDEVIAYLPQEIDLPEQLLVGEFLEGLVDDPQSEFYKVEKLLAKLELSNIDQYQVIKTVSPGQKMKLYLSKLILNSKSAVRANSPVLLLDEPTNHLDLPGILWLEKFVAEYDGIIIMISHDREFLNNTVDTIFEIDEKELIVFEGNYDDYLVGKKLWLENRNKQVVQQERKRQKLEKLLENVRKLGDGKARGKAVEAAKKRMEREVLRNEICEYKEMSITGLGIGGSVHKGKKMLEVKGLGFSYNKGKYILKDAELILRGKEKCWLLGANGIGKSTFVKLLIGELCPNKGFIKWGESVKYAYFSQDQSHLNMETTVADFIMEQSGVSYEKSFSVLKKYLFGKNMRDHKLKYLSPGQRARLSFAAFSYHDYDFLILDEPTNHLDIKTKEVIEDALKDYEGGLLLISHDRSFVKNVEVDKVVTIEKSRIVNVCDEKPF
ncbi:MAG: ABC-F family ATP-binding cassette domain-containing protein [Patescibacteria group bacterium]|nr:ABC-F family ATP-binding cassette domain-containing protein [Patescibacteria group bacterium]